MNCAGLNAAHGCQSSPVGYIEAWYVDPDVRRQGYGHALLAAAEGWAVEQGSEAEEFFGGLSDQETGAAEWRRRERPSAWWGPGQGGAGAGREGTRARQPGNGAWVFLLVLVDGGVTLG